MDDIKVIKGLEKKLNKKLNLIEKLRKRRFEPSSSERTGYKLNENNNVTHLFLEGCNINDINLILDLISKLKHLDYLSLAYNHINDLSRIGDLPHISGLSLIGNSTLDITSITKFHFLRKLDLSNTGLSDLNLLSGMRFLENLRLCSNGIIDIYPLKNLPNLKYLDLSGNKIGTTKPLEFLPELVYLYLIGCKIRSISVAKKLRKLVTLNISDNYIKTISPIQNCLGLEFLWLFKNRVSDLTPIQNLKNIRALGVGKNPIASLTPLKQLDKIEELQLIENNISDISTLSNLHTIEKLYLSGNNISDITPLKSLNKIDSLDLRFNPIEDLPVWLLDLNLNFVWTKYHEKGGISLYNNPLKSPPPEIVKQGRDAIANYFEQIKEGDLDYIFEAKLLIIGEPGAGKTSMTWKLENADCSLPQEDDTTKGIDIKPYYFPLRAEELEIIKLNSRIIKKNFRLNVWDFGGQEIYKATHRFFLSKRAVYALVADSRNEHTDFNYWLHIVEMFGGESPLLLVLNNKHDRKKNIDIASMRTRFNNIVDVLNVDFASDNKSELNILKRTIEHHVTKLPHFGSPVPSKWTIVRDLIDNDKRNTISIQDYFKICAENGISKKKDALLLSQYFHDIGVFLHFQDDDLLNKTIFLKPNWATNAVYKILDHEILSLKNGKFNRADVSIIWSSDEFIEIKNELLRLMKKFFLTYQVDNSDEYIVPEKLSSNKPEYKWNLERNLHLRYKYDIFMPKGIMAQLIVQLHRYIVNHDLVWRRGVILERNHAKAEVSESYDARFIQIRITGRNKRDFMTIITDQLDKINDEQYENLNYIKYIPCNCSECKVNINPHFYVLGDLERRIEKNRFEVECEKSFEMVSVRNLIDEILNEELQLKSNRDTSLSKQNSMLIEGSKRDGIFISYSHKDQAVLDRVQSHLKVLENEGIKLNIWDDTRIKPGMKWKEEIEAGLLSAKVGILIVSTDFLTSDFITKHELPSLLKAAEENGTKILSLIAKPCRFNKQKGISQFQAVNKPEIPLSSLSENDREEVLVQLTNTVEDFFSNC